MQHIIFPILSPSHFSSLYIPTIHNFSLYHTFPFYLHHPFYHLLLYPSCTLLYRFMLLYMFYWYNHIGLLLSIRYNSLRRVPAIIIIFSIGFLYLFSFCVCLFLYTSFVCFVLYWCNIRYFLWSFYIKYYICFYRDCLIIVCLLAFYYCNIILFICLSYMILSQLLCVIVGGIQPDGTLLSFIYKN